MADEAVLKVMHAARQDLEIFHHLGRLPRPFFDTQIAAMVCGFGEEVAYDTLVGKLAGAQRRQELALHRLGAPAAVGGADPLRAGRRHPPAGDLRSAGRRIDKDGRMGWVAEEFEALLDPKLYTQPPEDAWRRLKLRSRDARFVAIVQALAAWREREAQRRDLPRARIIRDDLLLEVAANRPQSVEELRALERVNVDRESAAGVVAAIRGAMALAREQLPRLPEPTTLPRGIGPTVDLLRVLLKYKCEEADVAQRLRRRHRRPGGDRRRRRGRRAGPARLAAARSSARTRWRSRPAGWRWRCAAASPW